MSPIGFSTSLERFAATVGQFDAFPLLCESRGEITRRTTDPDTEGISPIPEPHLLLPQLAATADPRGIHLVTFPFLEHGKNVLLSGQRAVLRQLRPKCVSSLR